MQLAPLNSSKHRLINVVPEHRLRGRFRGGFGLGHGRRRGHLGPKVRPGATGNFTCPVQIRILTILILILQLSKEVQTTRGAQVDAVRGLMNVMCTHTKHHVIPRGWEESFGVEVERSPIKGNRLKFLRTLVEDAQAHFDEFEWVGGVPVDSWVGASSCERVFSCVMATDYILDIQGNLCFCTLFQETCKLLKHLN